MERQLSSVGRAPDAVASGAGPILEASTLASKYLDQACQPLWRDDVVTPVTGARLAEILLRPRNAYSCPERIAGHISLSSDEKRLALCVWLRDLLAEGRSGFDVGSEVRSGLAELCVLDPAAAAVFRRAFAAEGLAPAPS